MKRTLLTICMFITLMPGLTVLAQDDTNSQINQTLQAIADNAVAAGDPGIVLWLDTPTGTFAVSSGYADVDEGIAVQPTDSFRIASVTKTYTATVVLQLVEEGVLALEDTLDQWLPDVAATLPYGDGITLRELLNHTSGVFDWSDADDVLGAYFTDVEMQQHQWSLEEMVAIAATHDANFAPGEAFAYSNTNYTLLGMVIEVASGQSLAKNYHQRIFDPLGLQSTYLSDFEQPIGIPVRGYSELLPTDDYNASFAGSAGGLVSTAPEVSTFFRALMNGELYRDPATLQTMLTGSDLSASQMSPNSEYALGIAHGQLPLGEGYAHDGTIFGFNALAMYFADYDIVLVILTNADETHIDVEAVFEAIGELITEESAS